MGGLDTTRVATDAGAATTTSGSVDARTRLALEGQTQQGAVRRTEATATAAPFDPVASADSVHTTSETIFHMKDAAEQSLTQGWPAASKNYDATIAQANTNNQQLDVPTALKAVDALLATTTDDAVKKTLLQEKVDLETIQKSPGFTLAVKAFAEKRLGMDDESAKDLAAAKALWAQLNPPLKMEDDPNFQKHLANVTAQEAQLKQAGTTTGQPTETQTVSSDVLPTAKPADDATIKRLNLPNDWNQESGVKQATYLLSQPFNADTKALYENAIAKAAAGPSPAIPALETEIQTRAAHIETDEKKAHPDYDAQIGQILTTMTADIKTLPADKQATAAGYVTIYRGMTTTKQEQDDIRTKIAALDPTVGPKINKSLDALDTLNQPVQTQIFALHERAGDLANEKNQLAFTRASYAQALFNANDQQGAQTQIVKAIGDNVSPNQAIGLKQMAVNFGVPSDQVAKLPDVATTAATSTTPDGESLPAIADAIKKAQQGFAAETSGDKAANLAKHQADFEAANSMIDKYMTAHGPELVQSLADSTAKIQAVLTPDEILKLQSTAVGLRTETQRVAQTSPTDAALYAKYTNQTTTDADKQTALAQLTKTQPNLMQLDHDFNALYSKAPDAINTQLQTVALLQTATAERFVSHEGYASALIAAGHPDVAVLQMREAFKDLPPNMRQVYSQDPTIKPLLDQLHFDMNTVPAPELPFFLKAANNVGANAPTADNLAGTKTKDVGGTTTGNDSTPPDVTKLIQQADADRARLVQLENTAQQTLEQKGLAAAKPLFDQAVKLADQLAGDPAENKTELAKGINLLTDKAHPLPADQEQALLAILRQNVTIQQNAADIHRQYASAYCLNHQWKDAQNEYGEADKRFNAIDNKLVGQFVNILNAESNRKDIDVSLAAQYGSDSKAIAQGQQQQIALRLSEASFYLLGGRTTNGTPVNWDTTTQKPVIDGNPPLKPEEARTAILKAEALDNEINGQNAGGVDLGTKLTVLANTYNVNVPKSLKIDIQSVKSEFQKPVSQIVAAGTGLAATFILAAVSEGRLARIGAGGDDAALAAIRAGEGASFITKSADYFASSSKLAKISSAAILSPVGRFAIGAGTAGSVNTLEQYYGLQNHEAGSRSSAFVEGAGAFTSAMALLGARNYAGKVLFSGATSEALGNQAIRILEANGGTATKEGLAQRFAAKGYAVPDVLRGTGPLTSDIASQAFTAGNPGATLMAKIFNTAERKAGAVGAAAGETPVKGSGWNPVTSDYARRNMVQNYSALTAFSLVNTMTASASEGISIHATNQPGDPRSWTDPWASWNPLRPINNRDGTPRGSVKDYAIQAMTSPLIGNLFFAELGSLPAAAAAHDNLGGAFTATRQEAQTLRAATTAADASQGRIARLWNRSTIVRPIVAEGSNQVTRVGNWLNPPGNFADMTVSQKVRQATYLPILANGGALQFVPMAQAALPWGPIGGMRAEWERELANQDQDIQNDAIPTTVNPVTTNHTDVVPPATKKTTPAVVVQPGGNGASTNGL